MNPRVKLVILLVALMIPYMSFFLYFAMRYPSGQLPEWLTNTALIWFSANFTITLVAARAWLRKTESAAVSSPAAQNLGSKRRAIWRGSALVVWWSGLFLYGVVQTVEGKFPLRRAIPAGLFLLVFMVLFSTLIYKERASSET